MERRCSSDSTWNAAIPLEADVLINDLAELGALIRRRRTELSLSQSELADMVETTRQWVSRLEKNKNDIGTARLLAVLDALELNLDIRPPQLDYLAKGVDGGRDRGKAPLIPAETLRALAQLHA